MPSVQVEFFGIARQLADCESAEIQASTIAELIDSLSTEFPELGVRCFEDGCLRSDWLFNIDGRFVRSPDETLSADSSVLLMSADAGG